MGLLHVFVFGSSGLGISRPCSDTPRYETRRKASSLGQSKGSLRLGQLHDASGHIPIVSSKHRVLHRVVSRPLNKYTVYGPRTRLWDPCRLFKYSIATDSGRKELCAAVVKNLLTSRFMSKLVNSLMISHYSIVKFMVCFI